MRAAARLDAATEGGCALAHPDQPLPAPVCGRRGCAVVDDLDVDRFGVEAKRHRRVLGVAVTERVRERLLHDPVDGELQGRCELARLAARLEIDVKPGGAHLLEQFVQPRERRLRWKLRRPFLAGAHDAEAVDVEVIDDGTPTSTANGSGQGLIGMRERATAFGGRVEAGPNAAGGFRVAARLPLAPVQR